MSGFLLDTNIVSMLAPSRAEASPRFLHWLERMDHDGKLFLSVVTIHEIEKGIALLEHKGATAKAAALKLWLAGLVATYDDKIIGVDAHVSKGYDPGMADAIIAGVAAANALHIVTRNTRHFSPFGVPTWSPEDAAAA